MLTNACHQYAIGHHMYKLSFAYLLIAILCLPGLSLAQPGKDTTVQFTAIQRPQFEKYHVGRYLVPNSKMKSKNGRLEIMAGPELKARMVYTDDTSTSGYVRYSYVGDVNLKGAVFILIKVQKRSATTYHMFDRSHPATYDFKLVGMPIFSQDASGFVCIDAARRKMQFAIISQNGRLGISRECRIEGGISIVDLRCDGAFSAVAKDKKGKYWKLKPAA